MGNNARVRSSNRSSSQILTKKERLALEKYMSDQYNWEIDVSRRIVISRNSADLRDSIALKSGDVFTLQGETLYHASKLECAKPLKVIPESGLFVVSKKEENEIVYLELVRVTDYAATRVAA